MKRKKFGVVVFPGSNCDADCLYVLKDVLNQDAQFIWHKSSSLDGVDAVVLPGGFSYGDYLRTGAIARFSPVMNSVIDFAKKGGAVIGICNGFQILLESGLLPGAMLRNRSLNFVCKSVPLRVESAKSMFTSRLKPSSVIRVPIAHGEGNYFAEPGTIEKLEANGQVLLRYSDENGTVSDAATPNGSLKNIAGIRNENGNVFGLMPHPERASESELGGTDGRAIFESMIEAL